MAGVRCCDRRRPRYGRAAFFRQPHGTPPRGQTGPDVVAGTTSRYSGWAGPSRYHRAVSGARGRAVSVAIIDYGSGNLHSAAKAFGRAARESGASQPIVVTSDPA